MTGDNRFAAVALLILVWVAGLQACTTTGAQDPQASGTPAAPSTPETAAVSRGAVTVENLLRWPLEGHPAGTGKVVNGLELVFDLQEIRPSRLSADGPARLDDGYVLSFARIQKLEGATHIGLGNEPCFHPERAVAVTGAVQNPVFQDAHGVDRGRTYDARRNGVWVMISTTPMTYGCVESIHIHPIR